MLLGSTGVRENSDEAMRGLNRLLNTEVDLVFWAQMGRTLGAKTPDSPLVTYRDGCLVL